MPPFLGSTRGRRANSTLSIKRPTVAHASRHQSISAEQGRHLGDWHGHDPIPNRRASDLLGWTVPAQRRKRRQAPIHRMQKGAPWLKTTLIQCPWAAAPKKGSSSRLNTDALRPRRGSQKKAIGACARLHAPPRSIICCEYGALYQDLGAEHFDRSPQAHARTGYAKQIVKLRLHLARSLQQQGGFYLEQGRCSYGSLVSTVTTRPAMNETCATVLLSCPKKVGRVYGASERGQTTGTPKAPPIAPRAARPGSALFRLLR